MAAFSYRDTIAVAMRMLLVTLLLATLQCERGQADEDKEDIANIGRQVALFERAVSRLLDKLKTIEVDIYDVHTVNNDLTTLNGNMARLNRAIADAMNSFNTHLSTIERKLNSTIETMASHVTNIKSVLGSRRLLCRSNENKICFPSGKCSCYLIGPIALTWGKSKKYCSQIDADLVTITTKEEDASLLLSLRHANESHVWINARQEDYNRPWRWMGKSLIIAEGETFKNDVYHNWMDGIPGVRKNVVFPRCLHLGWSKIFGLGGWSEQSCSEEMKPLCWRPLRSAKKPSQKSDETQSDV